MFIQAKTKPLQGLEAVTIAMLESNTVPLTIWLNLEKMIMAGDINKNLKQEQKSK